MGVLTTAYSISFEQFMKIKKHKKNLDFVLGLRTSKDADWKLENYDFDKSISGLFEILKGCGYAHTGNLLDVENFMYSKNGKFLNYEGYDIWFISPTFVQQAAVELRDVTFEILKTRGLANEVTDYYGKPILEKEYDYLVGDIENLKKFFTKTAENNHYLLMAEASRFYENYFVNHIVINILRMFYGTTKT
jgi:Domain of unknown function (DUF1877)